MTDSKTPEFRPDWFTRSFIAIAHILALIGVLFYFSWGAFFTAVVLYYITGMFGITIGFHRYLTHRSFKTSKTVERFLAVCGTLALQGTVLEWIGHHRMHHAGSDTAKDPHDANRGFMWSHMNWLFYFKPQFDSVDRLRKFGRDIVNDPWLSFISQNWVMVSLQVALGVALLLLGGIDYMLWGIWVRLVVVYHVTWFVNSLTHSLGYKNFETDDLSKNNWFVALVSFGEGWHNNHHANPNWAPNGLKWWEFDLSWQVIKLAERFGLVWDVIRPPENLFAGEGLVDDVAIVAAEGAGK